MSSKPKVIGSQTVLVGTTLFAEIAQQLSALPEITFAFAVVGIIIASLRMAMVPDDDSAAKSMATIRRILTILIFLAMLGEIALFICEAVGVTPTGMSSISKLLGMN